MPILAAGNNQLVRNRGFTLLETLVVLVILAMALAVVVPAISRGLGSSLDEVSRDLHTGLRKTHSEAVSRQQSLLFVLDLENYTYRVGTDGEHSIPRTFELHARTAEREMDGDRVGVRFYPDGSSSGGRIGLSEGDTYVWLEVDWLTGQVVKVDE